MRRTVLKRSELFWNLLFPPFCLACDLPLDPRESDPLCPVCRSRYAAEREFLCPECRKLHRLCSCLPARMRRVSPFALHIGEYSGEEESVVRALILSAKDHNYEALHRFMAAELCAAFSQREDFGAFSENCLVTYVPRAREKVAERGVDQARETAKRLARLLNCRFVKTLSHKKSRQQKKLSAGERLQNASGGYALLPHMSDKLKGEFAGKTLLLYDDVVTTGATMAVCASLLKRAGAASIVYLSFGMTYRQSKAPPASVLRKESGKAAGRRAGPGRAQKITRDCETIRRYPGSTEEEGDSK